MVTSRKLYDIANTRGYAAHLALSDGDEHHLVKPGGGIEIATVLSPPGFAISIY